MKIRQQLFLLASTVALCGCNGFFDKDNLPTPKPLTAFQASIAPQKIWATQTGATFGDEYLRVTPASNRTHLYTVSATGYINAINKRNGQSTWQQKAATAVSAGLGANDHLVVLAGRNGTIIGFEAATGKRLWQHDIEAQIMAAPAVSADTTIIKTIDGRIYALNSNDGSERWTFQQREPNMILRGASSPAITSNSAYIGFANGNLAKLNLRSGELAWMTRVSEPEGAFNIQRMIDIDANPVLVGNHLFAATYQGHIASLSQLTGQVNWSQKISSYTGMVVNAQAVFISDASSDLWRFNSSTGTSVWQQKDLFARGITAPALQGDYLVVGDAEGYVHWLNQQDGQFAARTQLGAAIYATPLVEGNTVYVINNRGYLAAYSTSK